MFKKLLLSLVFLLLAGVFSYSYAAFRFDQPINGFSKGEIIIQLKQGTNFDRFFKDNERLGLKLKEKLLLPETFTLHVPEGQEELLSKVLSKSPLVGYAEPNFEAVALETTNDPQLSNQWGMFKIQAADNSSLSAWNIIHGLQTVKIAIVDTGIDKDHEDLAGKTALVDRINFTTSPTDDDLFGHGTHVAGIAAAMTNNGIGVAGVGYDTSLMSVKVLDDDGYGYYSWVANGIKWAADKGATVINMSLGGSGSSSTLQNAVNYAWNKGVVIVAAAGNSGNSSPTYPAYYPNVIAVAATDSNDVKASWSSFGKWVDVAAPGVDIFSTFPNHPYTINKGLGYDLGSGTSMSTPFVSGLAGLLWATNYGTSNTAVRSRIESTADKIAGTGTYWSSGRINAYKAVDETVSSPTPTPTKKPRGRWFPQRS